MNRLAEIQAGVGDSLAAREEAGERISEDAEKIADTCRDMAVRFHRGGKIIVFGNGGAGATPTTSRSNSSIRSSSGNAPSLRSP